MTDRQAKPPETRSGEWIGGAPPSQADVTAWQEGLHPHILLPMIVFDLDGTLLDSYEMSIRTYELALAAVGLPPMPREMLAMLNGPTLQEACEIVGLPLERMGELEAAMNRADAGLIPVMGRLFPGVPEMLAALQAQATLCVLTNGLPGYLRQACEATGISHLFAEHGAFAPGVSKAMRIREWMEARGMPRTLMVGDHPTDVDAGREAGAATLAVTYGSGKPGQLALADAMAGSVAEVWRYCERFCKGEE